MRLGNTNSYRSDTDEFLGEGTRIINNYLFYRHEILARKVIEISICFRTHPGAPRTAARLSRRPLIRQIIYSFHRRRRPVAAYRRPPP
ncbi:hypothetical protein EVAR_59784_1 [Eumeta japonica]|uniref:Uncharacterized protein n=1 Tax=Eumeta variegata TaxID=151549 RepID=A0A4C1YEX5_EUMVA|nr:hypothetical protein EVAR_59784_1 [Eumeta japonica]